MGLQEILTAEVERVVSAPYAVALKRLHDILIQCDSCTIHAWADASACQVTPLAGCVTEALQLWPYALEILHRLAQARPFRDAFLQQDTSILDAFLRKATTSDPSSEVFQVCVRLLSAPLPQSVPLPLSAQEFFMRSFDRAVRSMEEYHVSVIHSLLDGACGSLLGILPDDRIEYIEEKAYELLKNSSKTDSSEDHNKLKILCLGLMGILAPACEPTSKRITPRNLADAENLLLFPQRSSSVKHLGEIPRMFRGSAARATIHLTVTLSVGVLSADSEGMDETTIKCLNIISRVLAIVPLDARREYFDRNAKYVSKFIEKVLKIGCHPDIQLQGLACVGLLYGGRELPGPVVSAYAKVLLSAHTAPQKHRTCAEAASISMPCFAAQLDECFVSAVLCSAVQAMVQCTSRLSELQWIHMLTQLLGEVAQDTTSVRRNVLLTLSSDNFQEHLEDLLNFNASTILAPQGSGNLCKIPTLKDALKLGLGICSLLLRAALIAQADELGMDTQTGLRLLRKQQDLASIQAPPCKHSRPCQNSPAALSLVQETCTPYSQSDSRDWRTRLAKELEIYDKQRIDLIERHMSEVCRDLEARCDQVEEPLHLEQRRVQALQEEVQAWKERNEELSKHIADLETRVVDRDCYVEGLEEDKMHAENNLRHANEVNGELSKRADDLQCRLDEANEAAERTLTSARQEHDRMKSELRALLAKEETRCEEQAAVIDDLKAHIAKIEAELTADRESLVQEQKTSAELKDMFDSALQHIEEQKTAKLQAQAEVSDLVEKESVLMDQLHQAHVNLAEVHKSASELKTEHESTVATLNAEMESLRGHAERELRRMEEEACRAHEIIEAQLEAARQEIESLNNEKENLSVGLQTRDSQIARLHRKLEKVTDARDSAEARVEEMETWRTSLLTAMDAPAGGVFGRTVRPRGHTGPRAGTITPGHHSRRRTFAESEIASDEDMNEDPDLTESERTQSPGEAFGSQRDSSASPTPKRAKFQRQQPFKPPILKVMTSTSTDPKRRSSRLSHIRRASTRKPLEDVSSEKANLSPVRRSMGAAKAVSFGGIPSSSAKSTKQDGALSGSFDVSDFMADTPLTPSGRHQQPISNTGSGDTTVDL